MRCPDRNPTAPALVVESWEEDVLHDHALPALDAVGGFALRFQQLLQFGRQLEDSSLEVASPRLSRRFRNESGNLSLISHEHDLFLIPLEIIENSTEVAGNVGHGQRLHNAQII